MKNILISSTADKPIYQQIYEQISSQIFKGELAPGTMLPSIRTLAKELRISIITIKKALEELEKDNLIYKVAGKGTFVSETTKKDLTSKRDELVIAQLEKDLAYSKKLGITKETLLNLIDKKFN